MGQVVFFGHKNGGGNNGKSPVTGGLNEKLIATKWGIVQQTMFDSWWVSAKIGVEQKKMKTPSNDKNYFHR